MTDAPIRLHGLGKRFGPVTVLRDINLDIRPGEVLGILGENGAGKSTLLKLISGVYQPSVGQLEIDGRRYDRLDPIRARQLGIAMIPQEFNLVPTLSVYENVFLGQELRRHGWLDRAKMRAETERVLATLDCDLDPRASIADLSVAQKQMVEVARVLVNDARLVILDEPTTVLTDREVEVLFKVVRALQQRGVAVLFISHKLKEVKNLCQRLLILRDGSPVELCDTADLDEESMARKMVGRELSQVFPAKKSATEQGGDEPALRVSGLSVAGEINDVSFSVRHGEILGLSGLVGSGRTEIAEAIMGLRARSAGEIFIDGEACDLRSPDMAHRKGLAYLSEDRQGRGLVLNFNLIENITLLSLKRYVKGLISHRRERERAEEYQQTFNIRAASLKLPVGQLSGGNQQKVYLAKLLDIEPTILMLDEPTRGIDVGTKREIYRLIRQLADEGRAILVISSELEEIIGLCDRVLVVREGRIAAELTDEKINEEDIMLYAAGARARTTAGVNS
ncbi:sugar ABC transporter ATP-binding protein [Saccharospirillum mangrovi]|uniref:sugar ABC transporter ATP-binding protein n=1 Tax=Saccharospirillum mangrovi TaxID=2161747 RepID=UPI000D3AC3B2|nr:sugar ABC transporter ATP-binding protein [Saccharospirillum mangrovi]